MTGRRAIYAADPARSRGRLHAEPVSPTRGEFQRDRDRVIHSTAFRRLAHKTQVFVHHEGDHYRSRLTHSIEVSQIARALARALGLDEDLAEALALAHDLGHTPFGHSGEEALDACMADHGGFDHNAQALRIVTRLEARYAGFDGLNLAWETLEGLVKHNGPVLGPAARRPAPAAILDYDRAHDLWLMSFPAAEAQAAALADDIAYDAHDLDDGLRAGLFDIADLREVSFIADLLDEIAALWPGLDGPRLTHELTRRVITRFVEDAIAESRRRLEDLRPGDADAIRAHAAPVVAFSRPIAAADRALKEFLFQNMYRHASVMTIRDQADQVIRDLFARFRRDPSLLPEEWNRDLSRVDEARLSRRIADYIAGMTDRFALQEHRRLFDATPELR